MVELEDEAEAIAPKTRKLVARVREDILPPKLDRSGGGVIARAENVKQSRLADAGVPDDRKTFPGLDAEVDTPQHFDLAVAGLKGLVELLDPN